MKEIVKTLNTPVKEEEIVAESVRKYVYEPDFIIAKRDDIFHIEGSKVKKLAEMTVFKEEEALRRFQNILKKMGVEKALEEKGIEEGDIVKIGKFEFVHKK
ncbi:MAG: Obg family GTPase CgtA [Elusimicrobia bacterium]|nr:Obg family GTPase CgtA [Elusimicrobiota bacterium]